MERNGQPVNRYMLVPRTPASGVPASPGAPASPIRRRYALGRVAVSPRSALGQDRHERLERAAEPARRD